MHSRIIIISVLLFCALSSMAQKESSSKKSYTTAQKESEITIDGLLNESAWEQVEWGGNFVGHRPEYNVAPTQETQFKILYDAKFLYVGIRAFDTEPDKIVERMSRRDGFDGDWVEINIDSYNDKRTAFSFTASVSGVKSDEYISNNGDNFDSTWDPIWYLKTSIDDKGWIAEFKIPLSQLRFANKEVHTWGMQFTRRLFREQERSTWQAADPNAAGWVHLFGELNGIVGIKPQKQLEIQPYVLSSIEKYPKEEDNPFRDAGKEFSANVGLDAKIGITSDITLDLTVNPDFGQVEADPSAVNLSAFRLFFREQRPFFLEGSSLLSFGTSGGVNNLFYSRRIGGRPYGYPSRDDVAYVDKPNHTRILGAAKLTGKNAKGFSWGILESITNREEAEVIYEDGTRTHEMVEPFANYMVARAQQDINEGKTVFGAILTNVNRFNNNGNGLEYIHDNAQSGGVDVNHNFKDRKYGMTFKYMFSRVEGTTDAIRSTQEASERFFQRPNNNHRSLDTTLTKLIGSAAAITFEKRNGNFQWTVGSNFRSPELELNDIGFLRQTDNINNWLFLRYRINEPRGILRSQNYNGYIEQNMDFGGMTNDKGGNVNMNWDFTNLWGFGQGLRIGGQRVSNADLRGGPSITYPGNINYWYWISTNSQKKIRVSFDNWFNWGRENFSKSYGLSMNITIRPTDALRISFSPNFNERRDNLQYVDQDSYYEYNSNTDSTKITKYVLGTVMQKVFGMSMRVNYNITPNLTLEFWGQPFIVERKFNDYKTVVSSNSEDYNARFSSIEGEYTYDENDDVFLVNTAESPSYSYQFDNKNATNVSFQSNMVMRWEYIPGSTLFLVWANRGSEGVESYGKFSDLGNNLLDIEGSNTFVIKYTYRFIL